jgi:hypothetical protein
LVKFDCSCDDKLGTLYATAFRDLIAKSPRYQETQVAQDDGKGTNKNDSYNWFIDIIPMDMTQPADGNASAFSIVLKLGNMFYLDHWAQTRGVNMADICAHTIFSAVDNELAKHK